MDRVLYIAAKPFFPWRSSCIRVGHELLALGHLGYAVDFLTVPLGAHPPLPGVRLLAVPRLPLVRNLPETPSLRRLLYGLLLAAWAVALARRHRYAVVHGFDDAAPAAWLAGRLSGAAVVCEQHAEPDVRARWWRRLLGRPYAPLARFALRHADAVIAAGPAALPAMAGRESRVGRIADIPASLDAPPAAHVAACRDRILSRPDDILVTYVGSFATFQGLELLFGALERVRRADNRVRLAVVGGSAAEIGRQQRRLGRKGLAEAVAFLGRVTPTDLAAVLAASDILVSPRLGGTRAPMKVLDYLQSGTAIVATDCPANRDALTSDVAVLTAADPAAFAEGILALCRDPARRHELGFRGRERVRQSHGFDAFRDGLRRCYAYVLATWD